MFFKKHKKKNNDIEITVEEIQQQSEFEKEKIKTSIESNRDASSDRRMRCKICSLPFGTKGVPSAMCKAADGVGYVCPTCRKKGK